MHFPTEWSERNALFRIKRRNEQVIKDFTNENEEGDKELESRSNTTYNNRKNK